MTDIGVGIAASTDARAASRVHGEAGLGMVTHNVYRFECYGADGALKWSEEITNLVTTEGANDILTQYLKGSAYTATWYVGLITGSSPTLAGGDTAASHAAWTEFTGYSQGTRVSWVGGTAASGSIDNSASQAAFSINATGTIGGAFLISNSTKSGTTGKLYGEAALSAARSLASGDTLNITVTLTIT